MVLLVTDSGPYINYTLKLQFTFMDFQINTGMV